MQIMNFSAANCKNCYKCVRFCPVKAIKIDNYQAKIIEDRCIACGHCFMVCPQNARNIKSDLDKIKLAIEGEKKVIASIAPSFASFFEEPKKLITALKKLGFEYVEETAIAAEEITNRYIKYIEYNKPENIITSCCPSVNFLVQRYYPKIIPYMLPIISPMLAHGQILKKRYENSYVVFIGPCISKKCEAAGNISNKCIDAVLTFEELVQWLEDREININELEETPLENIAGKKGSIYPIAGGILTGMKEVVDKYGYDIIKVDGTKQCKELFESIKQGDLKNVCVEASVCEGGCVGGPGVPKKSKSIYVRKMNLKKYLLNKPKTTEKSTILDWEGIEFSRTFVDKSIKRNLPSEEDLKKILRKMGKYEKSDELNCGACGYDTCREKAKAVYEGMSQLEMCMPYMRSKAEKISNIIFEKSPNAVFILDEDLMVKEFNPAAEEMFHITQKQIKSKPISTIIDDTDFRTVIETKKSIFDKKVYYTNYGVIVLKNILFLEKQNMILVILLNLTSEEKRKRELAEVKQSTLDIAQKVIEKQMRVAQEIASLLGETTAETKVTLTKLKQIVLGEDGERK
ncbi:[Fe-Fe] hydrogenase large subunit C-terminal domain-containing protein [Defluviitalea phaphyphila]|uniref:[Fe-Fe] hydrogenase large subunit C-terminal domain-containing protein n=1 Tax=Defluviitalea phaphyphila TaxID=1473580 RepID=UPI000731629F|nr:[Fe-Fe] hydrogenase large subunit C-terminal domain-containing protein [Defluviitalea phaphyphila]